MDQKTVVHLHNGILCSRKKERTPTLHNSMDGTGEYCAKWNKPGERQIPYDLTYKRNLKKQTSKIESEARKQGTEWKRPEGRGIRVESGRN